MNPANSQPTSRAPQACYARLYAQVLAAIALGVTLVCFYPQVGESMKLLDDAFIKFVKMVIVPVIFLTIRPASPL
ncbi:cation:dicarboxylate symporter family transporter [Mesorhizobium waimense]|uniref:cation:dicarboxylate symporter family transporter n=1 Tax=Mesorhizobium waimense TaxID=1300307 RepID=UPI0026C7215D